MDYTKKYLKYKSKYLELKELIAGARKRSGQSKAEPARAARAEPSKAARATPRDTELMTYIKAGNINIGTLSRVYGKNEDQKDILDENNNIPLYVYINNTDIINMDVVNFLLPDDRSLLAKKKNDGDTIMHSVVKKNNLELLNKLWSSGGKNAKLVNNNAGLNLLKLAERLKTSDIKYEAVVKYLTQVYDEDYDKKIRALESGAKAREALIKASGVGVSEKKPVRSLAPPPVKIVSIDKRISTKSSDELLAKFNDEFARFKEHFIFGKKDLIKLLDEGIQFEAVYVEPSKIDQVPDSPNIFSINKIEMKEGILKDVLKDSEGIISLIAVFYRVPTVKSHVRTRSSSEESDSSSTEGSNKRESSFDDSVYDAFKSSAIIYPKNP